MNRPMPIRLRSLWLLAFTLLISLFQIHGRPLEAQSTQGSILGTVKDANGALLSGATVTLTNVEEGVERTTTTNAAGSYLFSDVVAAHYNVAIEAQGFEQWKIVGAPLASRQQLRVDAKLTVGSVRESIQVTGANASSIDTESASINAVYSANDAVNLPTNSRASANGTS